MGMLTRASENDLLKKSHDQFENDESDEWSPLNQSHGQYDPSII